METMHRWFVLMHISNCSQHVHKNNPDFKQFDNKNDERLHWLETKFVQYSEDLNWQSTVKHFLTTETYEALLIICHCH